MTLLTVAVLGRGRGTSAPSLFVQPPLPVFPQTTYYCPLLVFQWHYVDMSYRLWDIQRQKWRNLKTGGRGRSRSLKMAPFDRSYTTFYWSAIVSIALCCTIFRLFDVESWHWKGHWRPFKLVPFESLGADSYSPSIVSNAVSLTVYEICSVKE